MTEADRIRCPKCACPHVPVLYTRHRFGKTVRRRRCRFCLHEFHTTEILGRPPEDFEDDRGRGQPR